MSGTVSTPAPTSSISTPSAVAGSASAAGIVLVWGLGQFHIAVPPEVALAMLALVTPVIHWLVVRMNAALPEEPPTTTGATP